jgi:Ca2+-binding RTX toxin-like protein
MADTIKLASGATEADIIKALASMKAGGTLILPEGETISISKGLSIDVTTRDITLDLNGSTLVKAGNVSVITGVGGHDVAAKVALGEDAGGNTTLTYSKLPAGLSVGSWVKVISDDALPGDLKDASVARMGQALEVLSVNGNTVTFKSDLIDQDNYKTNVRASTYQSGELVIKNGDVVGDQKHPTWNAPLVQLRSLVGGQIEDVNVRDGVGRGINVVDGVNNQITDVSVKNMIDGGSAALGIGISSLSSTGTTVKGYYAENVTHAADNNAIGVASNSAYIVQYGGDIGMHVEDAVAYGTRNFAYSWHSEAVDGAFKNVMAFDSFGFMTGRGIGGSMTDSGGAGNQRGILLYEYGDDDSRNITIDNVTLKETANYSLYSSDNPANNTVKNSYFESAGPGNLASASAATVINTTFAKAPIGVNDVMAGTAKADLLLGGKGVDTISGGAGGDYIWGGAGADTLTGGAGRDRFAFHSLGEVGDTITDFETGGIGDVIDLSVLMAKYNWADGDPIENGYVRFVQDGANVQVQVDAAKTGAFVTMATLANVQASKLGEANVRVNLAADDTLGRASAAAPVEMLGAETADTLQGGEGTLRLAGFAGDDLLTADAATATLLEGGIGNDTLTGGDGGDTLDGGAGIDTMAGGKGDDTYMVDAAGDKVIEGAGGGFDTIVTGIQQSGPMAANVEGLTMTGTAALSATGNALDNVINGNAGVNVISGGAGDDTIDGGAGNDQLDGGVGNDTLSGGDGNDRILAGDGDDILDGGKGSDTLSGGLGADSVTYEAADSGATVDLNSNAKNAGAALGDGLSSIENLKGSAYADVFTGNAAANRFEGGAGDDRLYGGAGHDAIYGGSGADWLEGGTGKDTMHGGAGSDTFYFASFNDGADVIADFHPGEDKIALSKAGFGLGSIDDLTFISGNGVIATTGKSTMIYNTSSGQLLWDADGSGAQKALLLATLTDSPHLSHSDFVVM